MKTTTRILPLLLGVAFGAISLHAGDVTPSIPSAFNDMREVKPEEMAEGTPIAQVYKIIKAVKADAAMLKADPKSKGNLEAIYSLMTPFKMNKFKKSPIPFRDQAYYSKLNNIDIDKVPTFNVQVSTADVFVVNFTFFKLIEGETAQAFVFKKIGGKWLYCDYTEVPAEFHKKIL